MALTIDSRVIKDSHLDMGTEGESFVCLHDGTTLQFAVSYDGVAYSAPVPVATISSLTPKSFHVLQENAADSSRLRITNGLQSWVSEDGGVNWSPF